MTAFLGVAATPAGGAIDLGHVVEPARHKKTIERSNLYCHGSGPDEEVAVDHRSSAGANVPVWRSSERSTPEEMPASGGWGWQEYRAMLER